ncbi:MAG: nucleoside-diphosphate sugar epimerase [Chlorobi bacterium]|nr:nucleoside-diphosphate sugar epimerase [Chlorobiota bacterium]
MKCLITGGAGFIGSHLAQELIATGNFVTVFDNMSTGSRENLRDIIDNPLFELIEGDLLDTPMLEQAIAGCDEIYHLAAMVGVKLILERPLDAMRTNMEGTAAMLGIAAARGRPVLIASSSEVYGHATREPLAEDDPRQYGSTATFRWAYAGAKAMGESLALAYHRRERLPAVVARLFNVAGPRQSAHGGMVIPSFVEQALRGTPITVYGTGRQTRCFSHVLDVARAMIRLLRSPEAHGEIFNIGGHGTITMAQLAVRVRKLAGSSSPITFVPYRDAYPDGFEEIMGRVPDLRRIERAIGYRPELGLETIIRQVIEHARAGTPTMA